MPLSLENLQSRLLDSLNVQGTQVTAQGIADLKFVFPNCKIGSDHTGA